MTKRIEYMGARLSDNLKYKEQLEKVKATVKVGNMLTIDDRKGKVIAVHNSFFVLEFTVYKELWGNRTERYRESFHWDVLL